MPASRLMNNLRAVTVLSKEQTEKHWNYIFTRRFTRLGTMFAFLPLEITLQSNDTKAFVVLFVCLQVIRYNFSCFCGTNPIKAVYKSNTCFYLSAQKQLFMAISACRTNLFSSPSQQRYFIICTAFILWSKIHQLFFAYFFYSNT